MVTKNLPHLIVLLQLIISEKKQSSACYIETHPHAATLRTRQHHHFCGGVFIHRQWVLTAAHCVFKVAKSQIIVLAAEEPLYGAYFSTHVVSIFIHDFYDPKTLQHDVSLLFLERRFPHFLSATKLAGKDLTQYFIETERKDVEIVVWEANKPQSKMKQSMKFFCIVTKFLQQLGCIMHFAGYFDLEVMFCVASGDGEELPCKGDSGSPVYVKGVVTGLVSFGVNCEITRAPSVLVRVDSGIDFFRKTVMEKGYDFVNDTEEGFPVYYIQGRGVRVTRFPFLVLSLSLLLKLST